MADEKTLYDMLGGAPAITAAVEDFYRRLLADPELAGFFVNTPMRRQTGHQIAFLSTALRDRPVNLQAIQRAHAGRGIQDRHFNRVAGHLIDTLLGLGVPQSLVDQVVARVAPLRSEIVEAAPVHAASAAG